MSGCGKCRHMRGNKCTHPKLPVPVRWRWARRQGWECGPTARLWEPYEAPGESADTPSPDFHQRLER